MNNVTIFVTDFESAIKEYGPKFRSFPMFVIYCKPMDFPDNYVIRMFNGAAPTPYAMLANTLPEARKCIPASAYLRVPRSKHDSLPIVETWL